MDNPSSKPKLKILLVDDDLETRQLVSLMFANSGHKLLVTGHGKSAMTLLEHEKVDLILLDIMMPELDGLMMLEMVRRVSAAPVLMLTALSDPRIMEQSFLLGADDYLTKPFTKAKLLDRVDRLARQLTSFVEDTKSTWSANFRVDMQKSELIYRGLQIAMTTNELKVFSRLLENAFTEVNRMDLYEAGWGRELLPQRTMAGLVDSTLASLREKLEADPHNPRLLLSSERGYTFSPG